MKRSMFALSLSALCLSDSSCILVAEARSSAEAPAAAALLAGSDVKSLARLKGDGRPTCGLGRAWHAERRAELRRRLGNGVVILRGLPEERDYVAFHQDKLFWYLTGIESPGVTLVMDARTGREVLFLPEPNKRLESWDGEMWDSGDAWVKELTGFTETRPAGDLLDELSRMIGTGPKQQVVWISAHPAIGLTGCFDRAGPYDERQEQDLLDGRASREDALEAKLAERFGCKVQNMSDVLAEMRRVKTREEVDAMGRAARAGALAFVEVIRSTRPGLGEWDLEAVMRLVQTREGADGPAYHAIVGSGENSCVLHYSANRRVLQTKELVLIDYGPEVDHYTTDITRTWPTDGVFTPAMAELYDAVLEAQKAAIAVVKPGATIAAVDAAANAVLEKRGFARLVKHGTCHYIGMEVHDPGDYTAPFVPGVAFTIEPGLYDEKTGLGVRIEDVVVVTEQGCDVLSKDAPKERAELEALFRQEGVLDRMDRGGG